MKTYNIIKLLSILLLLSSCTNGFEELNRNPNDPEETHPQLLLTNICWSVFSENSKSALYASRMLVQSDGENSEQFYKWTRGSFSYYSTMRNVTKMKEEAEKQSLAGYVALAHFFRAHCFFNLALTFGDVPYEEALQGESSALYTPRYDTQEEVLKGVIQELEMAENMLASEVNAIDGDIIFGGKPASWRKAVNAYRLKVLMTLSAKAETSHAQWKNVFATVAAQPLMESVDESAQLVFLDQQGNRYPRFNDSDFGSGMYMDSTFVQRMVDRKDARLITFVTQTKEAQDAGKALDDFTGYEGGDPTAPYNTVNAKAVAGKISKPNARFYAHPTNEPLVLIGYAEQELILAEAVVRGWIAGDAKNHYENGVKASFKFYETYATDYAHYLNTAAAEQYLQGDLVTLSNELTTEQKLNRIMMQRYIASYFQGGWTAYFQNLRTGYPGFMIPDGRALPYRWMYPQAEYTNNPDNVEAAINRQFGQQETTTDKTWWLK